MPGVAVKEPYTLILQEDDDAQSPRETADNFGTMICFHRRYNLGDKHDYEAPEDFLRDLVETVVPSKTIIDYVLAGKAESLELQYNLANENWDVLSYWQYSQKWEPVDTFPSIQGNEDTVACSLIEGLANRDLLALAKEETCILPLFLYDHSGLSMSTASFAGRAQHAEWDSGQVGWIYATKETILAEYGGDTLTPELMENAETLMKGEVSEYGSYLRGECYGYQLYENDRETDSCWGFIGSVDELKADIESCLPEGCKGIMDSLEYRSVRFDIADILAERAEKAAERPSALGRLKEVLAGVMPSVPSGEKHVHSHDAR